jgi:hypothetical protein
MYYQKYIKYKSRYFKLKYGDNNSIDGGAENRNKNIEYLIHDNGGRPFRVVIDANLVKIYKQIDHDDKIIYSSEPVLVFEPKKTFIGKSPINEWTKFSGGYGKEFDGNTILLQIDDDEYIYIGSEIFSFDTKSEIVDYVSIVGNNDVPYPYAVDKNGNIYLITEDVILKNNEETTKNMAKYDNPYEYFYHHNLITDDEGRIPPQKPSIQNFDNIDKFYIGKDKYTLTYEVLPENNYDRLMKSFDSGPLYIKYTNGQKKELTKNNYVKLMKSYGEIKHFEPLIKVKIYQDRDINGTFLGFYVAATSSKL